MCQVPLPNPVQGPIFIKKTFMILEKNGTFIQYVQEIKHYAIAFIESNTHQQF